MPRRWDPAAGASLRHHTELVISAAGSRQAYEVTTSAVRYDDDPCTSAASQQPWSAVVGAHGTDVVTAIDVTTGFTGGKPLAAILRTLRVNGTSFVFGAA